MQATHNKGCLFDPDLNPSHMHTDHKHTHNPTLPYSQSREGIARQLYSQIAGSRRASGGAPAALDAGAAGHPCLAEFGGCKVVYRSMEDGDVLLTNRQPTLHKPGMMAHRARIMRGERWGLVFIPSRNARQRAPIVRVVCLCIPPASLQTLGHPLLSLPCTPRVQRFIPHLSSPPPTPTHPPDERTIRFHYANCATFNADFDGDEINLHLPQDQLGRAEGYGIVSADHQFFVPTDGKPLRGLIQDHIVAGTLLTLRDRFFTAAQYHQLVYEAVCTDCSGAWEVWLDEPALVKPVRRWTGKQVLTAVLMHYTRDQLPFSMSTASRVPVEAWGKNSGGTGAVWWVSWGGG